MPNEETPINPKPIITLMDLEEYARLLSLPTENDRVTYAEGLRPQLGLEFYDSYADIQVYVSFDRYEFKPVTVGQFLELKSAPGFDEAVKEIIDVSDLYSFLDQLNMDEEPLVLFALVWAVIEDLELEFEDIPYITSLGGPRGTSSLKSHVPILKPIYFDKDDEACNADNTVEGQCVFHADIALLRNSYESLFDRGNWLEIYVKSTRHHKGDTWKLTGRYHLLNKLADQLDNPHIRRIFLHETGDIAGRLNSRRGDFRRSLVRKLKGAQNKNQSIEELIMKLANELPVYRQSVDKFYQEQEDHLVKVKERIHERIELMEALEKKMLNKETVDKHLTYVKLLDVSYGSSEYWARMYDDTNDNDLKNAMDSLGGRDLSKVRNQSLYTDCLKFNLEGQKLDTDLRAYLAMKENALRTLRKRRVLFHDLTQADIAAKFVGLGLLVDGTENGREEVEGFRESFKSAANDGDFDSLGRTVAAYNSLDRQFVQDIRKARTHHIQDMLAQFDDVYLTNILVEEETRQKFIRVRLNPIKVPTPRDIGRELGGVIRGAGNVVNEAGRVVTNVFDVVRKGGEDLFGELNKLKLFIEEEGPKFEKYLRKDLGGDIEEAINNILIKPINWIFCGGRQPSDDPAENDNCLEGGIKCTRDADGTSCQLTDPQGNPSEVPGPEQRITAEQIQWMKQVEQQDLLNSMDFSEHLRSWMTNANQASLFRSMLISNHAELLDRINAGYEDDITIEAELAADIRGQASVIDLISAGLGAAADHVVDTVVDMLNIAKTVEELGAVIDFIGEHGSLALVGQMGDSLAAYWDEYQLADEIGKAEIIGRVTSDVAMILVPASTVARFGHGTIRTVAASSTLRRTSLRLSEATHKHLGKVSGDRLANYMGEFRRATVTQGNFDFSPGTLSEVEFMKECWIGTKYERKPYSGYPGKWEYHSHDGTKVFREPVVKKTSGKFQANFENKKNGERYGNAHMLIIDGDKLLMLLH